MARPTDRGPVEEGLAALRVLAAGTGSTTASNPTIARLSGHRVSKQGKSSQVSLAMRTLREDGRIVSAVGFDDDGRFDGINDRSQLAAAEWSLRQQRQDKREVVVMGDFNTTPWSGRFRKFLQDSNLRNSLGGFGLQPTWHAALPSPLMVAILTESS